MEFKKINVLCDCGNIIILNKIGVKMSYYNQINGICNKCNNKVFMWVDLNIEDNRSK